MRGLLVLAVMLGAAGPLAADPDWPCIQRLVPELTSGTLWAGHEAAGDWRADPAVAALVGRVAPRSAGRDAGVEQLRAFAASIPAPGRPAALNLAFAGLVDETNAQRGQVIRSLRDVAQRQRDLTGTASRITAEIRALPAGSPEREEAVTRRGFVVRDYEEVGRTIRYACEVPVALEARLGAFAQALQAALEE